MPRVSKAEAQQNHTAIERASARLMRVQGLRLSVADIMGAAGLTHGGFYGHFPSKDELLAVGCANAFADSVVRWRARSSAARGRPEALAALIQGYLGDDGAVVSGCPLAALASDVAREAVAKPVRRAFQEGLEQLLAILTDLQPRAAGPEARARALLQLSTMVGAVVLARATRGQVLSEELRVTARRGLPAPPRAPRSHRPRRKIAHKSRPPR
jgi:TetR/AcrR family transcriptional regulator, transcriptional repressor for nem operon